MTLLSNVRAEHACRTPRSRRLPLVLGIALLASFSSIAAAQPASAPMAASATPTGRARVWAATLFGDLATWEPSAGWEVRARGGIRGGVAAITFPPGVASVHREQVFYVRDGRVRSMALIDGAPAAEITLPGVGSATFEHGAIAATTYGAVGMAVAAFTTSGSFCTWNGSIFGFPTAPTCVAGGDRYSAIVATTMSDSWQDGSFVAFFYRSTSGNLMRRMQRIASGDFRWGSTVMARGVSRPMALLRDTSGTTLAFVLGGRVRTAWTHPRSTDVGFATVLPATAGTIVDNNLGLAIGFGEGPNLGLGGGTRCTTTLAATTSAGLESASAFDAVPGPGCSSAPRPTSSTRWSAPVPMPSGATWGGATLVLPGLWFGQATRILGIGLRPFGSWLLPYDLLEVTDRTVISHGRP